MKIPATSIVVCRWKSRLGASTKIYRYLCLDRQVKQSLSRDKTFGFTLRTNTYRVSVNPTTISPATASTT